MDLYNFFTKYLVSTWFIEDTSGASDVVFNCVQVIFIITVCRYLYMALIKKGDARYVGSEALYSLCFVAPLIFALFFQLWLFVLINFLLNIIVLYTAKAGNKQIDEHESQGMTSIYPNIAAQQREAYNRMSSEEKENFQQQLREKAKKMRWKHELRPVPLSLLIWGPSIIARLVLFLILKI